MALNLCFKSSSADCDGERLAEINKAMKLLKTQSTEFEQEKLEFKGSMEKEKELFRAKMEKETEGFQGKMEKERKKLKRSEWKFEAEVLVFSEKKEEYAEKCRKSEREEFHKKTELMAKERKEFKNQQDELQRERNSLFRVKETNTVQTKALFELEKSVRSKEKAVFERERSVGKMEDKLELANLKVFEKQKRRREFQETGEARLALEKLEFSKEKKAERKRCKEENEILTVREYDQQQKEEKQSKDLITFSKEKEKEKKRIQNQNESLLLREEYVHRIEVTVRADMQDMFKREFAVEKSKLAVGKREKAVGKSFSKLKEKEERMTEGRLGLKNKKKAGQARQ